MTAAPPDAARRAALGAFLRAHRERLDPRALGIADLRRRRTPGLRREEVAQRAGLSATWYSWIEQGREVSLSAPAVARLARALELTPAERAYVFDLAGRRDPDPPPDPATPPPALARLIADLPHPAYLVDRHWDALAWNRPATALFRGWLDQDGRPNLLRFIFLSAAAPRLIPAFDERAARVLAEVRADLSRHPADPVNTALIAELTTGSPLFARLWDSQDVLGREGGRRAFHDPDGAARHYDQLTLVPLPDAGARLVVLLPDAE
ncbi:helix-turn-helix transcriptional regulator [Xanthobacter sp. V4C-4]|uniref:helix-turn-helix transcriptional regulator n=1 Tax=Xanthobacter cornucopiae TaxID=3119924 RepID=UPI003726C174